MVEPLSKRAQLPSSLVLTLAVFRPTPMHEWVWVQEGSFPRGFYAQGALSGVACLVATNFWEDQSPFFAIPFLSLNLLSLWLSPVLSGSLSPGDQGYHTQSHCSSFSDITLLHWWTMWCSLVTGLHHWPPQSFPHLSQQGTQPPSPLGFWAWVCLHFTIFYHCRLGWEGAITLQLPGWKEISLWVRMSYIQTPSSSGFGEQGVSGFCPPFSFQAARSNLE